MPVSQRPKKKRTEKGVTLTRKAADDIAAFLFELGTQFLGVKNLNSAHDCFSIVTVMKESSGNAFHNLGVVYTMAGRHDEAYKMFKRALELSPGDIREVLAVTESARRSKRFEEACKLADGLVASHPDEFMVRLQKSTLEFDLGNIEEAEEWALRTLELNPEHGITRLNLTLIRMTRGLWAQEWENYEKYLTFNNANNRLRNMPHEKLWDGISSIEGKTLLVVADQGHGDTFQFSRFIDAIVKAYGPSKVIFYCQPTTASLCETVPGVDEVVPFNKDNTVPDHDAVVGLLGIARILWINQFSCVMRAPYIKIPSTQNPQWDDVFPVRDDRMRVGLVWAGSPAHGNDHRRSTTLGRLLPILFKSNVQYYSLQVGDAAKQTEQLKQLMFDPITDLGDKLETFLDTAVAMKHLDLIISVDTAVAHLAGAMGLKCWLLTQKPAEWRWGDVDDTTPWYPTMRIFRQIVPEGWEEVGIRVAKELEKEAQQYATIAKLRGGAETMCF